MALDFRIYLEFSVQRENNSLFIIGLGTRTIILIILRPIARLITLDIFLFLPITTPCNLLVFLHLLYTLDVRTLRDGRSCEGRCIGGSDGHVTAK